MSDLILYMSFCQEMSLFKMKRRTVKQSNPVVPHPNPAFSTIQAPISVQAAQPILGIADDITLYNSKANVASNSINQNQMTNTEQAQDLNAVRKPLFSFLNISSTPQQNTPDNQLQVSSENIFENSEQVNSINENQTPARKPLFSFLNVSSSSKEPTPQPAFSFLNSTQSESREAGQNIIQQEPNELTEQIKTETVRKPKFAFLNIEKSNEPTDNAQNADQNAGSNYITADKKREIAEILDYDKPLGFGIFRAFQYLQNTSQLIIHKGENEQILEYRDEFGNLVDPKAAYRVHSHAFHGRLPGSKQLQKYKQKSISNKIVNEAMIGDTPLQSGKALREALATSNQPFIELTGSNRQILPYIPAEEPVDARLEKRKKRLKKIKKKKVKSISYGKHEEKYKAIIYQE